MKTRFFTPLTLAAATLFLSGCSREPVVYEVQFEPNLVHAMKYQIKEEISMDQASADAFWLVEKEFGTPDEPKLPALFEEEEDFQGLISLEKLQRAAGPAGEGTGLYRTHCASCHGDTGNGRGVNAVVSNPYPRDYRLGIFKFKSTDRGAKPTREDIARTIRHGIPGTTMKKIPELTEEDIDALTDYVIYLSLRGQLERTLIDEGVFELDLEVDRIIHRDRPESLRFFLQKHQFLGDLFLGGFATLRQNQLSELAVNDSVDFQIQFKHTFINQCAF
ncbi:MAG: cytochrome c, partial [Planctomycetota bacterium]